MEEKAALKCCVCGNCETFIARGIHKRRIEDAVDGISGEIDEYNSDWESDSWTEYDCIECEECGAEVKNDTPKEEADKIIIGAFEWLREDY